MGPCQIFRVIIGSAPFQNKKSRSLVLGEISPATGYVFLQREGQQIISAGPLFSLYSVVVRVRFLPESQKAVLPSTFSHFRNPGFRASKNRAVARFFERISFLYPQDGPSGET